MPELWRKRGVEQLEFADFYVDSRDICLRAVLASVVDRSLAEDLVAEAFTRALMSWPKVSRHPAPRAWVVRTALNTRVSWWRKRRKEVPLGITAYLTAVAEPVVDVDPGLLRVLRQLPRRQREVIAVRVFLDKIFVELPCLVARGFLPLGVALKRKLRASGGCLGTERR